jgi:hypothetical protein
MPESRPAPDPADSYERSRPSQQAGMGRMDNNKAVPEDAPDRGQQASTNRQNPERQVNAQDAATSQPDHSMHDEEPDGWDQAPTDIKDPRMKRHPRTEGRGGTP